MNPVLQKIDKGAIDQAMARQGGVPGKRRTDDQQAVVTATTACARVSRVLRRLVDQFQTLWRQGRQALTNERSQLVATVGAGLAHAGRAFLKGLTVTRA